MTITQEEVKIIDSITTLDEQNLADLIGGLDQMDDTDPFVDDMIHYASGLLCGRAQGLETGVFVEFGREILFEEEENE